MFGRYGVRVSLCAMALAAASLGWAPAAQAHARAPLSCTGVETTPYSPGLSLTGQSTVIHAEPVYSCTDRPGHTLSASGSIDGVSPGASCLTLANAAAREVVHYADGGESQIVYRHGFGTRVLGANTLRLVGTVVSGRGKGSQAERSIQTFPAALPTACAEPGGLAQAVAGVELTIAAS